MAISVVQRLGTNLALLHGSAINEDRITLTAAPAFGSTVIVSFAVAGPTTSVASVTDRRGNVYVQAADSGNHSPTAVRTIVWICRNQSGLVIGDTIEINFVNGSSGVAAADEVSGLGSVPANAPDKTATAFSGTAVSAVSVGPTAATSFSAELVWCAIGTGLAAASAQSLTPGSGYTQLGTRLVNSDAAAIELYTEYSIVAATGAQTATATLVTNNSTWAAALVTLAAPQTPASTLRAGSFVGAEVATRGANSGGSFVGAEVATRGASSGGSFIGVEVAGNISPATVGTARRPSIIMV